MIQQCWCLSCTTMVASRGLTLVLPSFLPRNFGSLNLTTVDVSGVVAALNKHENGTNKVVKAVMELDKSGILNVTRVYASYEVPPPPQVGAVPLRAAVRCRATARCRTLPRHCALPPVAAPSKGRSLCACHHTLTLPRPRSCFRPCSRRRQVSWTRSPTSSRTTKRPRATRLR